MVRAELSDQRKKIRINLAILRELRSQKPFSGGCQLGNEILALWTSREGSTISIALGVWSRSQPFRALVL